MEVVGAIGTIHTLYSLIKAIFELQETVVKHKEEVEAFAKFVGKIEKKLQDLEQRSQEQTLPSDLACSLGELLTLLEEAKHLLEKLQKPKSYLRRTRASSRIRHLHGKIDGIRLDISFEHVLHQPVCQHAQHCVCPGSSYPPSVQQFHPQPQSPSAPPVSGHPARRSESPSFTTSRTLSYYPPDHAGIGWKAYRDRIYPGHPPAVVGRMPDCNRFHHLPQYLSPYPTQGTPIVWRTYQSSCRSRFPGPK